MLPDTKSEIANKCREILKRPGSEIEKESAYIAVQEKFGFNELRPMSRPSIPRSVYEYQQLRKSDQIKFVAVTPGFFREGGEGYFYHNGILRAKAITRRNKQWLKDMKVVFDKDGDNALSQKVQARLYEFDDAPEPQRELAATAAGNQSAQETSWTD
jgi:hypothetical protein